MMQIYLCAACGRLRQTSVYYEGRFVCPKCFKTTGVCTAPEDIATLDFLIAEEDLLSSCVQKENVPLSPAKLSDKLAGGGC